MSMNFQDADVTKELKAQPCVWKPTRTSCLTAITDHQNRSDQPWQGIISFIHYGQKERWYALNHYQ